MSDGDVKATMPPEDSELEGTILAEYIQGDYKLSMWIPGDCAGRVVGRKGVVITNLQTETKARQINALSAVGDSLWVAVVIMGDWKSVTAAYYAVSEIVNGEVDDVVLEFHVNNRKPFFIYGKSKLNIVRLISAKSNVRVFLPELGLKEQTLHEKIPPMTLEGSFDNVKRAIQFLEEEATSYRERYGPNGEKRLTKSFDKDAIHGHQKLSIGKKESENWRKEDSKSMKQSNGSTIELDKKEGKETEDLFKRQVDEKNQEKIIENHSADFETKPESTVPPPHDSPALSVSKRMNVERVINIPSSIVGLLLSKRPPLKVTVMNQIQSFTNTIISKIVPMDGNLKVDESHARRKDSVETIDTSTSEAKSSLMEDDSKDSTESSDEDNMSVDSADFQDAVESPDTVAPESALDKKKESEFVIFRVIGFTTENVDAAFNHLDRIIKGERIREVMESLKSVAKTLPRRDIGGSKSLKELNYKDRERKSSHSSFDKKISKEKRNSKILDRQSTVEKASEKDGVWRKEKLSDKPAQMDSHSAGRPRRPAGSTSIRSFNGEGRVRGSIGTSNKEAESDEVHNESPAQADPKSDGPSKRNGKFIKRT